MFFAIFISSVAVAKTLHYGDNSIELTDSQRTYPALHIQIDPDTTVYSAMYDTIAPKNTLRISYNDTQYWLGPWCEPGSYLPPDKTECTSCGIGYYCTGGMARSACDGGIISCRTPNNATNLTAPDVVLNHFLTLDEVIESDIPQTDMTQWTLLSQCNNIICYNVPDRLYNTDCGCDVGTLEPGTYLFLTNYSKTSKNAEIAVFDHPVGYMIQHSTGVYAVLIDTNNPTYIAYTLQSLAYTSSVNNTNIIGVEEPGGGLYIYKLN